MAGSGVIAFVVGDDAFVAIGIGDDRGIECGEVETGACRGARQMIAFVPALDAAVPQDRCDRLGEGKRAAFDLGRRAESGEAMDKGLLGGHLESGHVLYDRIGPRKAERDALMLRHARAVEHDIANEVRTGLLEEAGYADRERIDRPQVHGEIILFDELERLRQRQIAEGAAEGEEEVDRKCHLVPCSCAARRAGR